MLRRLWEWRRSSGQGAIAPNQETEISLHQDVEKDVRTEITRLFGKLTAASSSPLGTKSDLKMQHQYLIGLLIIVHALRSIRVDGRYLLFRPASSDECKRAGINAELKDEDGHSLVYHFFETYGYRFTILLNLQTLKGIGLHMERVTTNMGSVADSLAAAEKLRTLLPTDAGA